LFATGDTKERAEKIMDAMTDVLEESKELITLTVGEHEIT
jgi:hypothetical protein